MRPEPRRPPTRCTLTVCHGCCCGTLRKHPDVDSAGHRDRLAGLQAGSGAASVRVVDCVDACDHSNVIVVGPSRRGRELGGRPVWLGAVLADEDVDHVLAWVSAGGPGVVDVPGPLLPLMFSRAALPPERSQR